MTSFATSVWHICGHVFIADTYDVVVNSGGMGEGHIPTAALVEMIRVVKPGTYPFIVNVKHMEHIKSVCVRQCGVHRCIRIPSSTLVLYAGDGTKQIGC